MQIDRLSYCLGMIFAFSEVVGSGVKPLALSPPLEPDEAEALLPPTRTIADQFGIQLQVDDAVLTTRLFDPAFTAGKTVILMAADQAVLAEYAALKAARGLAGDLGRSPELEEELACRFGRLLGYSDDAIARLLQNPRFAGEGAHIARQR
jgi:hypothetical protein